MKIIRVDGYDRDSVAQRLVAEGIRNQEEAKIMLGALCDKRGDDSNWYRLVEDNHILWRGMAEFVDFDYEDEAWRANG